MKSLLQEAPSIERAISQAWESAGRPQEFSVKIHEQGKRGFLGFSSKPAVVSITYKPLVVPGSPAAAQTRSQKPAGLRSGSDHVREDRRGSDRHDRHERSDRNDRNDRTDRVDASDRADHSEGSSDRSYRTERQDRGDRNDRSERGDRNDRRRSGDRRDAGRRTERSSSGLGVRSRGLLSYVEGEEEPSSSNSDLTNMGAFADAVEHQSANESHYHGGHDDNGAGDSWEVSYVDSINAWLNEIISTIGYNVTFESRVSGKILHVEFSGDFVADAELSRSLYAALSFVLLQFLKREHKRRFRGLRIALTHPGQEPLRFDLGS